MSPTSAVNLEGCLLSHLYKSHGRKVGSRVDISVTNKFCANSLADFSHMRLFGLLISPLCVAVVLFLTERVARVIMFLQENHVVAVHLFDPAVLLQNGFLPFLNCWALRVVLLLQDDDILTVHLFHSAVVQLCRIHLLHVPMFLNIHVAGVWDELNRVVRECFALNSFLFVHTCTPLFLSTLLQWLCVCQVFFWWGFTAFYKVIHFTFAVLSLFWVPLARGRLLTFDFRV